MDLVAQTFKKYAMLVKIVIPGASVARTLSECSKPGLIDLAVLASSVLTSDRPDSLYPTIVSNERGVSLGLVYSSIDSLRESLYSGRGVYQSRARGLWYKGATSGAFQDVKRIRIDCDGDALQFLVRQHGTGFCHLETRHTCFGNMDGLSSLDRTLRSRMESAPEGSYTARLFQDEKMCKSSMRILVSLLILDIIISRDP